MGAAVVGDQLLVLWQGEEPVELVPGQPVAARLLLAALPAAAAPMAALYKELSNPLMTYGEEKNFDMKKKNFAQQDSIICVFGA